jgi:hypothetical protein
VFQETRIWDGGHGVMAAVFSKEGCFMKKERFFFFLFVIGLCVAAYGSRPLGSEPVRLDRMAQNHVAVVPKKDWYEACQRKERRQET